MYYESVLIHGFEKQQMINDSPGSFRQLHNSQLVGQVCGINHREFQQQKKEREGERALIESDLIV